MSPRIVTHIADSLCHVSFKSRYMAIPLETQHFPFMEKTKASNFFKDFLETFNGLSYTNSICF